LISLRRKVTNVIGDEKSRADQPDARCCDDRRNGAGANVPPIGTRETRSRTGIKNSSEDEVDALPPPLRTDRKRADRVPTPIVASTPGSDQGESRDEERPGHGTAGDLSGTRP
jgi:hypothetical protein